jgi:hypothetical protein
MADLVQGFWLAGVRGGSRTAALHGKQRFGPKLGIAGPGKTPRESDMGRASQRREKE